MRTIKVTLRRKVTAIEYTHVDVALPEDIGGLTAADIATDILHNAEKQARNWVYLTTASPASEISFVPTSRQVVAALCRDMVDEQRAVETLRPETVTAYLQAQGWHCRPSFCEGKTSLWIAPGRNSIDALVPTDKGVGDYALQMGEAIRAIATFERRPLRSLIADLSRVASEHPNHAE